MFKYGKLHELWKDIPPSSKKKKKPTNLRILTGISMVAHCKNLCTIQVSGYNTDFSFLIYCTWPMDIKAFEVSCSVSTLKHLCFCGISLSLSFTASMHSSSEACTHKFANHWPRWCCVKSNHSTIKQPQLTYNSADKRGFYIYSFRNITFTVSSSATTSTTTCNWICYMNLQAFHCLRRKKLLYTRVW